MVFFSFSHYQERLIRSSSIPNRRNVWAVHRRANLVTRQVDQVIRTAQKTHTAAGNNFPPKFSKQILFI